VAEENADVLTAPAGWLLQSGWQKAPARLLERLFTSPRYRRRSDERHAAVFALEDGFRR
jgi:hypothetical protein